MKIFLTLLGVVALVTPAFAQAKKEKQPAEKPAAEKPAEKKPDAKPEEKAPKALPMNARADVIDASAKTFTMKRKDGVEVKHMITETTDIKQGEAAAKFEDIKVGDTVSGSRHKKSDTEYEVVKITKFGVPVKKEPKEAKPVEEKKP